MAEEQKDNSQELDPKTKKKLESLKKKAKSFGIDFDLVLNDFKRQIINEVKASIPPPAPEINKDELVQAVKLQIIDQITNLTDKFEKAAGQSDPKKLVEAISLALQPKIVAASTEAAKIIFNQGAQGLLNQVRKENEQALKILEEKLQLKQSNPNSGSEDQENGQETRQPPTDGLGGLVANVLGHLDEIKEIVAALRPAPANTDLRVLLQGINLGQKLKTGELTVTDLTSALLPGETNKTQG